MRPGEKKWFDQYIATHSKKKFKDEKQGKNHERSDMIITREFPGRYYLHIPYIKEKSKQEPRRNIIAIDPGFRTLHYLSRLSI
ncbi:hypothetical protein EON73_05555 [bacterium]|nr:MAG: hypothetical protein EON73_05555 [bacterium]